MDRVSIRIELQPGRVVARFTDCGQLTADQYHDARRQLVKAAQFVEPGAKLVLDLRPIRFMSSAMIGVFVLLSKECRGRGGGLEFWHLRPAVLEVFRICRLDRVFRIRDEIAQFVADPNRFCPELFEARSRVLAALETAGYSWVVEFSTISPIHDLYGLEVDGIRNRVEAIAISRLLRRLFPEWGYRSIWLGWRWGAEPTWKSCIWRDDHRRSDGKDEGGEPEV